MPTWKLLPGVTAATHDYVRSDTIASDYDNYFSYARLFELDRRIIAESIPITPGMLVADLGCGTGRSLIPLVERGATGWAIDLSQNMLQVVQRKADQADLDIHCLRANLVQLDCLTEATFDAVLCMFSTLGMVHGHVHRQRVLSHIGRILKPGGRFVLHVHNYWNQLTDPGGWRHIAKNLLAVRVTRREQRGDRYYPYRGLPKMYLHTFTRRELRQMCEVAGLETDEWHFLAATQDTTLKPGRFRNWYQASGWIITGSAVCRTG